MWAWARELLFPRSVFFEIKGVLVLGHNSFDPGPVSEFSGSVPDKVHNESTAR